MYTATTLKIRSEYKKSQNLKVNITALVNSEKFELVWLF